MPWRNTAEKVGDMPVKITPAIEEWCRALENGVDCRLVRETHGEDLRHKTYVVEGPLRKSKPTWAMVDRLEEARLITWESRGFGRHLYIAGLPDRVTEYVAKLTAAGRGVAAREMKVVVPRSNTWPF